jgi:hypothetical protein
VVEWNEKAVDSGKQSASLNKEVRADSKTWISETIGQRGSQQLPRLAFISVPHRHIKSDECSDKNGGPGSKSQKLYVLYMYIDKY